MRLRFKIVADVPAERRDLQALVGDMRVDVAQIKTRLELQTGALVRLENKLDLGIFREEYERRHKELTAVTEHAVTVAEAARDENLRREGAARAWRIVFTLALAALGMIEAILYR